ncbi:unnamed protein product [Thelazia callipaeda]|uniref:SAC domain-containing protein n=1 Tax=Thelazia callipaeda TaxID=103827 RepID=A0A0N5D898_THECL|nr:unnamed protein product [Thelazia callipaeda]
MKLLATKSYLYLVQKHSVLKCCKTTRKLFSGSVNEHIDNAVELGEFVVFIGKILVENECYLLLGTQCTPVASYPCINDEINRIDRVIAVPVEKDGHPSKLNSSMSKLEKIKISQKKVMHFVTGKGSTVRLIDEILRLFNDGEDFYVCFTKNITLNIQRRLSTRNKNNCFFWNYSLLTDLYDDEGFPTMGTEEWIMPVCQGFVAERTLLIEPEAELKVALISRRSINRAGVRYLKRGVDENGEVANFVETEVILAVFGHCLSFVQVRGSVPVFWTQQGYRYRPPLVISKTFTDSYPAYAKHIKKMLETYDAPLTIVNLVEQRGREVQLALSFLQHVLHMNSPDVSYFTYDFHSRCRGLRFYKVAELVSALSEQISSMGFCWVDKSGEMIHQQRGVIRTNCVDCLDRTNIVQCAISQAVCLVLIQKLGIIGPQTDAPIQLIQALQSIWADNGDAISRQYAGTDALKGDITRSGQRNLVGLVKDGYNSASRYYLSHMRDAQRQLAIDALLGRSLKSDETHEHFDDEADEEEVESIGRLVREAILFILPEKEILIGAWALVEGSNNTDQIDSVLLLTKTILIAASYDDDTKLSDVKRIDFNDIKSLECGRLGKLSRTHLRLYLKSGEQYTWRAAKTRLFNNVAILLRTDDEANEYIQAIGEQVKVTMSLVGKHVSFSCVQELSTPGRIDKSKKRVMNTLTSLLRPRTDYFTKSQFEQITFSKLDDNTDTATSSSIQKNILVMDSMIPIVNIDPDSNFCETLEEPHDYKACEKNDKLVQQEKNVIEVSRMFPSTSDVQLSEKTDNSLFQKFKLTSSKSNNAVDNISTVVSNQQNPFWQYKQQILDSKSHLILL